MRPPKSSIFFIDRSLGKHEISSALRSAGASVEVHDDHFPSNAEDTVWLTIVGERGWIVLTKDQRFRHRIPEISAIARSRAKVFQLSAGNLLGSEMADIFSKNYKKLLKFAQGNPAPFVAKIVPSGKLSLVFSKTQLRKYIG